MNLHSRHQLLLSFLFCICSCFEWQRMASCLIWNLLRLCALRFKVVTIPSFVLKLHAWMHSIWPYTAARLRVVPYLYIIYLNLCFSLETAPLGELGDTPLKHVAGPMLENKLPEVNLEIRMVAGHYREIAVCRFSRAVCFRKALCTCTH